jgi:hypothetical protein
MNENTSDTNADANSDQTVPHQSTVSPSTISDSKAEATAQEPTEEIKIGFRGKKTKVKRKPNGAPAGNKNAMRHALNSGGLPPNCSYIARQINSFRTAMEKAILDVRGQLGVYEVACVQTATEYHCHALKCRRWARIADDELSHDQRLNFSREIAKAFESRDKILRNLGLNHKAGIDETILDALYSHVPVGITDRSAGDPQDDSDE